MKLLSKKQKTTLSQLLSPKELLQGAIGAFTAVLLFFAVRSGDAISFNPNHGLLVTIILVIVYYMDFNMKNKAGNAIVNICISFLISAVFANMFMVVDPSIIWTYEVFGSAVIVGVWFAYPVALLFDKFDFINPLKKQYVRKGRY